MEPTGQFFAPAKTAFPPSMAVRCIHGDFAEHEPPHIPPAHYSNKRSNLNQTRSALADGWYRTLLFTRVLGTRADDAVVSTLLEHVCSPAGHPRAHENWREQWRRNAHEAVGRSMEEIRVGEQLLLIPHQLLDGAGNRINHGIANLGCQLLRVRLDHFVTRIRLAVDSVTKAHDQLFASHHRLQLSNGFI